METALYDAKIPGVVPQRVDERTIRIPIPKCVLNSPLLIRRTTKVHTTATVRPTVDARLALYTSASKQSEDIRQQIRAHHSASLKKAKPAKHSVAIDEVCLDIFVLLRWPSPLRRDPTKLSPWYNSSRNWRRSTFPRSTTSWHSSKRSQGRAESADNYTALAVPSYLPQISLLVNAHVWASENYSFTIVVRTTTRIYATTLGKYAYLSSSPRLRIHNSFPLAIILFVHVQLHCLYPRRHTATISTLTLV